MKKVDWKKEEKEIVFQGNKLNVVETIEKIAMENPDKLAVVFKNRFTTEKLTYSELIKKINQVANYLNKKKIKKNSRVFIFLPKCIEFYYLFLGIIKHGSVPCPIFEAFQEQGLYLRLDRGDADAVITNKELSKRLDKNKYKKVIIDRAFRKQLKSQKEKFSRVLKNKKDTCLMIFTSSTAGTPVAGIQIPHQGAVQWKYTAEKVLGLDKNKNYFCSAHPAWVTGSVYGILAPLLTGCCIYSIAGRFDVKAWLKFIKKNKIDIIYTAPTVLRFFRGNIKKSDLENVEKIFSVGEALQKSIVQAYHRLGLDVIDTYWQTETGAIVVANVNKKEGSIGEAIGVKIKTKKGMMVIEKSWPAMMTGIYKHEKMYKSYFLGKEFKTNDLAVKKGSNFYFSGRRDDMIKTSGERVSPIEIENILLKHPAVKEVAVFGIPDKQKGEIIKAVIVVNRKFEGKMSEKLKEQISMFVKQNYAGHSYPKVVEFIDKLPKGNSGKIIKSKLK